MEKIEDYLVETTIGEMKDGRPIRMKDGSYKVYKVGVQRPGLARPTYSVVSI